jgi:hypothetical protein
LHQPSAEASWDGFLELFFCEFGDFSHCH